jgi:hypothetical protein
MFDYLIEELQELNRANEIQVITGVKEKLEGYSRSTSV